MARTEAAIYLEYSKANQQADALDQIAERLGKLSSQQFQECLGQISVNWQGSNADAYIKKGKTLQGNISQTAGELKKAASVIRKIAKTTYDAEMRARELARQREY